MHPLLLGRMRLALFGAICLMTGVLLAWLLRMVAPRPWPHALLFAIPMALFYGFAVLSAWWVCRSNPLTPTRTFQSLLTQAGAALQTSAVWTGVGALYGVALTRWGGATVDRVLIFSDVAVLFAIGIPLYLLSALTHYLVLAGEQFHAAQKRILLADVAAREAELRALRAQLNPHFLFNSLNSINSLVGTDPEGARRMCELLGGFLRRTLALGARDEVTITEELQLVDHYLSIEQVRFGDRLQVERALSADAMSCRVPPLLLQPLVENAIKHGVSSRLEGGCVRVSATRQGDLLRLGVENPIDDDAPARAGEGVGLENVRRRLAVFGSKDAHLEAVREPGRFRVTLTLPARPEEART